MSVYKKLHQVQAATRSLAANTEGQTGAARYNYVSGSKLLGVIRPMMDKLGLILMQEVVDIKNEPITYMTRNGEKTEMFTTAHIRFTWVDTEDGSSIMNDFFANGMNAWDKGLGSALTYAERYYLMKTFHIATDEDDIDAIVKDEAVREEPTPAVKARRAASGRKAPSKNYNAKDYDKIYKPMSIDKYWLIVEAYARGKATKTGGDYRDAWIEATNAGPVHIEKFDHDVENYRIANNL